MIKIIVVAIMATTNPLQKDSYVFTEPYFESVTACRAFVNMNLITIAKHLRDEFKDNKIDNIYCIPQKTLERFLENTSA